MPNPLYDYADPDHPLLTPPAGPETGAGLGGAIGPGNAYAALMSYVRRVMATDPAAIRQGLADQAAAERQRSVDMGYADPNTGLPTGRGLTDIAGQWGRGVMLGTTAPGEAPGITVYHGSPHSFDRFSSDYIGSGTGESQFSRGLHFANEADAKVYRDTLAPQGHLYEVNIKADPEHFLDWDKPLSEQSPYVQKALKDAGIVKDTLDADPTGADLHTMLRNGIGMVDKEGGLFYPGGKATRNDVQTVQMLRDAGIPGMRHHGDSYVVYDDSLIDILRKYGIAGLGIGGAAASGNALDMTSDANANNQ